MAISTFKACSFPAQEEINAAGGINGVPIEVVIEDDRCDGELTGTHPSTR